MHLLKLLDISSVLEPTCVGAQPAPVSAVFLDLSDSNIRIRDRLRSCSIPAATESAPDLFSASMFRGLLPLIHHAFLGPIDGAVGKATLQALDQATPTDDEVCIGSVPLRPFFPA
jgi:hypothetical protein